MISITHKTIFHINNFRQGFSFLVDCCNLINRRRQIFTHSTCCVTTKYNINFHQDFRCTNSYSSFFRKIQLLHLYFTSFPSINPSWFNFWNTNRLFFLSFSFFNGILYFDGFLWCFFQGRIILYSKMFTCFLKLTDSILLFSII